VEEAETRRGAAVMTERPPGRLLAGELDRFHDVLGAAALCGVLADVGQDVAFPEEGMT
jgi:hypothetical protein